MDGYYWNTTDAAERNEDEEVFLKHVTHTPFKSAMGFTFARDADFSKKHTVHQADESENGSEYDSNTFRFAVPSYQELFVIGYSFEIMHFSPTKFYFISGLCYAIMVY